MLNIYFDPDNVGVFYDTGNDKWAIFQESTNPMTRGASFNVLVGLTGTGAVGKVLKAGAGNTIENFVLLNNSITNNNSRAMVFATSNYDPGGIGGTLNPSPIGVFYDKFVSPHKWSVFNEDSANMPIGAAFNLLIFGSR